jgi:hypothetical protein
MEDDLPSAHLAEHHRFRDHAPSRTTWRTRRSPPGSDGTIPIWTRANPIILTAIDDFRQVRISSMGARSRVHGVFRR